MDNSKHTGRLCNMREQDLEARTEVIRRFNRFFTRQIGVLREGLLHSPYSLTEARIIFEVANRDSLTATVLCRELGLDAGYLSRMLARLEGQGVITKVPSESDARQRLLRLIAQGQEAFALLDKSTRDEDAKMHADLSNDEQ